jgi:hypothetical protein
MLGVAALVVADETVEPTAGQSLAWQRSMGLMIRLLVACLLVGFTAKGRAPRISPSPYSRWVSTMQCGN